MMSSTAVSNSGQSDKPIWYFMLCWAALNAVQAYTLELHADEAYYWLFAQKLDWGYFYHPPMIAVFIKIGDSLLHNELGLRLATVLSNSLAIYLLWLVVKKYAVSAKWFILLVSGILIFHVYGFTSTPDAPLFFFAVVFYYYYQRYLDKDTWLTACCIGIVAACLLYSKYHGVLLIGFTLLANPKVFTRKTFYLALSTGLALYAPHIAWQMHRDFPAVNYQLFAYIGGQLALGGTLIGWYLFYRGFTTRPIDVFTRTLLVNAIGTFAFFLLSSLKAKVQDHYTLIGFIPLVALVLISFKQKNSNPAWLYWLAMVNVTLIIFIRLALITALPFLKQVNAMKSYFGFHEWAKLVQKKVGNSFVIMDEGFQNPSKYDYYNRTLRGFAYDSRFYGRTMFDIWPMEDSLQHQRIYYLVQNKIAGVTTDSIKCEAGIWYGGWVNDTRTYQKIAITNKSYDIKAQPGQQVRFDLSLTNPYLIPVNFTNQGNTHPVVLEACFFVGTDLISTQKAPPSFNAITLQKRANKNYKFILIAPAKKGIYALFFSLRTEPFSGSKNSRLIKFTVE